MVTQAYQQDVEDEAVLGSRRATNARQLSRREDRLVALEAAMQRLEAHAKADAEAERQRRAEAERNESAQAKSSAVEPPKQVADARGQSADALHSPRAWDHADQQ